MAQNGPNISRKNEDLLSEVCDDVSDEVPLFLQLVISHHRHDFVIVLGEVKVAILPLWQEVGHILKLIQHNLYGQVI